MSASDEVLRLHGVVAALDEERDRLTAELDAKVKDVRDGAGREAGLRADVTKAESTAAFARREVVRLAEAVDGRDRQIQSLKLQLEAVRTDAANATRDAGMFKADLQAATTDLVAMTRENQLVSAEVTSLKADQAAKADHIAACDSKIKALELSVKEVESDQGSLMAVYQEVCNDYKLLQAELDAAVSLRNQLEEQTAALSAENGRLRASVAAEAERRDTAERALAALQESLDQTTRQLAEAYQGSPVAGRTPSEVLAEAGGVGEELARKRAELAAAIDQTVHHRNVMMEAQADADAARAQAQAAEMERQAAMDALQHLRMQFSALEEVAKGDRIALADAHVLQAQLRQEVAVVRNQLSDARGTDPVMAAHGHTTPSTTGRRPPSPLVSPPTAADDRPVAMDDASSPPRRGGSSNDQSPSPGVGTDSSPDSAGSATTDAFAALLLENESLKADLRQALARLREGDAALKAHGLGHHVGAGEVLEEQSEGVEGGPTRSAGAPASSSSGGGGGGGGVSGLDMIVSPKGGPRRSGSGVPSTTSPGHADWATEYQLMEAEFRALQARCESLEATVRRQASSIQAYQMDRQRARRHMLRYESELAAYRRADPVRTHQLTQGEHGGEDDGRAVSVPAPAPQHPHQA